MSAAIAAVIATAVTCEKESQERRGKEKSCRLAKSWFEGSWCIQSPVADGKQQLGSSATRKEPVSRLAYFVLCLHLVQVYIDTYWTAKCVNSSNNQVTLDCGSWKSHKFTHWHRHTASDWIMCKCKQQTQTDWHLVTLETVEQRLLWLLSLTREMKGSAQWVKDHLHNERLSLALCLSFYSFWS